MAKSHDNRKALSILQSNKKHDMAEAKTTEVDKIIQIKIENLDYLMDNMLFDAIPGLDISKLKAVCGPQMAYKGGTKDSVNEFDVGGEKKNFELHFPLSFVQNPESNSNYKPYMTVSGNNITLAYVNKNQHNFKLWNFT